MEGHSQAVEGGQRREEQALADRLLWVLRNTNILARAKIAPVEVAVKVSPSLIPFHCEFTSGVKGVPIDLKCEIVMSATARPVSLTHSLKYSKCYPAVIAFFLPLMYIGDKSVLRLSQ